MPRGKQIGTWVDGPIFEQVTALVEANGGNYSRFVRDAVEREIRRRSGEKAAPVFLEEKLEGSSRFYLSLCSSSVSAIEREAKSRRTNTAVLAARLLDTVAQHNLFLAVLNDADEPKTTVSVKHA